MSITNTEALTRVIEHREIFHDEMLALMRRIMSGEMSPVMIAALAMGLRVKKETVGEIAAAAQVMREFATPVPVADRTGLVDIVGTGGDSSHTFNISTASMFVAAAAGARVLIASRKADACAAVAAEINALGVPGSAEGFSGDVATEEGIAALVAEVQSRTDKLHILMNNAGRTWGAPLGEHPYDAWDKLLSLNVTGMFHLTQSLLPLLLAAKTDDDPARVINVGSVMGDIPKGTATYSYAVSKGAVHHMTRVLANDLAARRITVNAIAPGPFVSKMTAFALADEDGRRKSAAGVPLGRVGTPEDVAKNPDSFTGHYLAPLLKAKSIKAKTKK
jgi:NAD(P)-dependent dehydrogenase (short-subunit alcohol dehydrogenase family)